MSHKTKQGTFALVFGLLCAVGAWAQTETGQIAGTVTDATGAVITGASVTANQATTGRTRSTTSTSSGNFVIANVLAGTYQLTVTAPGFQTYKRNVVVTVGARVGADVRM